MKIAVLADVHANLAALETVLADVSRWLPDRVVIGGDVVNRGPQPRECLDRILEGCANRGWQCVRGNHEDFVLREARSKTRQPPWLEQVYLHTQWTSDRLGDATDAITSWPDHVTVPGTPPPGEVRCAHASMRSNRHGLYTRMADEEILDLVAPAPAVMVVGHTHRPFVRRVDGTLVVNAGAVGLPFDEDPRAAYARITRRRAGWEAEVVRLEYDRQATERAYASSGYAEDGGPMVPLILDELRNARPWLSRWHHAYEPAVAAGELTVAESVRRLMAT